MDIFIEAKRSTVKELRQISNGLLVRAIKVRKLESIERYH